MLPLDSHAPHVVVIVALPPAVALDITGPLDVFGTANSLSVSAGNPAPYAIQLASPDGGPIATTSGLRMLADMPISAPDVSPGTVLVAGGPGARAAVRDQPLLGALRGLCNRAQRVGSICTGAFALAGAGLLDNARATTHWAHFDEFAALFPTVELDRDALFIDTGACHTSAGITAGIDYALSLIEADLGRAMALEVARNLVVFLKRPGGQAQFSAQLAAQLKTADADRFDELARWIDAHMANDLAVEILAERVAMSPRNFARRFVEKMQMAPAKYVERVRVDAARRLLTDSDMTLARIADRCGFGSAETMRQAFKRHINIAPADFRARFRSTHTS